MRTDLKADTVVEVCDRSSNHFQYATVVNRPVDRYTPNDDEVFIWVRYDNGCVVPVREYYVRSLTTDQVVAELNKRPRA